MSAKRPLHIVHTEASCGWGGQEIHILEESRGMVARGHRISILCPAESTLYQRTADWGLQATALPIGRKNLSGLLALRRWLATHASDIDVINTHSSTDSWLAALATYGLRERLPIVRTRQSRCSVGLPVVTTNVGSMTDVIRDGETGLLVTPKDSVSLAEALRNLVATPDFAQTLGARARSFAVNHCGIERMVKRMEKAFMFAAEGVGR